MWGSRRVVERAPRPPQVTDGALAARAAREKSRRGLLSAIDSGPEVRAVADRIAEHGRRNGFTEAVRRAYQGD